MGLSWPDGFAPVPDAEWTGRDIQELASKYDTVEQHGWYQNLDPTVEQVAAFLRGRLDDRPDDPPILVDYSGGTGIFIEWLLLELGDAPVGVVNVDASPKFLRRSLEKFHGEPRVAFRRIRYLDDEDRLQRVDEVLGPLADGRVDGLVSTNAIHLYYDLPDTLAGWHRVVRPGGRVFVQSGNIERDGIPKDRWIIDRTVEAVQVAAEEIVLEDDRFAPYRDVLEDEDRWKAYADLRRRFFLPTKPVEHYLSALRDAGFEVVDVVHRPVPVRVREWYDFLEVYHEGVLGWIGGSERIEGEPPDPEALEDRLEVLWQALERVFPDQETFQAEWTYITCERG